MPHVVVKMYAGRSREQKTLLAEEVTRAVTTVLGCGEESVSVAIEDVNSQDWMEKVYRPDILDSSNIYKQPGYGPASGAR